MNRVVKVYANFSMLVNKISKIDGNCSVTVKRVFNK